VYIRESSRMALDETLTGRHYRSPYLPLLASLPYHPLITLSAENYSSTI